MIRQGILVFEDASEAVRLTGLRVAGLSLLDRGIRTMARAGLERLIVIVPTSAPLVLTPLTQKLDQTIEFLTWDAVSALSLPPGEGVLVLLGDHVHHHSQLRELVEDGLDGCDLVVQTTRTPSQDGPFLQVSTTPSSVTFAATSQPSSRVSTGAFLCSSDLLSPAALPAAGADFRAFLQTQTRGRPAAVRESSLLLWRRTWDRRSVRAAKNMLFTQVTKKTSGFVSRHLNARISIPTSKFLVETGMSPHMITVLFVLTTGLAGAYLVSQADDYAKLALAGLLWQFAAVLDRCDGEVARVKLCESKFGAWFDTVTDNIAYICGYVGLLFGMRRLYPDTMLYWYLGLSAIAALLFTLAILYTYARRSGSGSLQHYLRDLTRDLPASKKNWVQKLMQRCGFITKRDFFSFFIFLTTLVNRLEIAYWFLIAILHLTAVAVLLSQHKMLRGTVRQPDRRSPASAVESSRSSVTSIEDRR